MGALLSQLSRPPRTPRADAPRPVSPTFQARAHQTCYAITMSQYTAPLHDTRLANNPGWPERIYRTPPSSSSPPRTSLSHGPKMAPQTAKTTFVVSRTTFVAISRRKTAPATSCHERPPKHPVTREKKSPRKQWHWTTSDTFSIPFRYPFRRHRRLRGTRPPSDPTGRARAKRRSPAAAVPPDCCSPDLRYNCQ